MPIAPGQIIDGKYRVLRCIGKGGMGTVYEGENVRIERRVAIKVLHPHVAEMPEFAQRFEREARASARIGSPHVCDVLDFGDLPDGERFIVMEFLDGMSLEDRLADEKMSAITLAPIAFDLLEGLGTMHNVGVVHRDLKPANVFLSRLPNRRGDAVKILDFGVAKIVPKVDDAGGMTSTGMMMGTPLYMSPEQARGAREVDGRADLYSASVIFFRALSGALPYMADNLHELIFKIAIEEPRHIKEFCPELDDEFAAMIMKGLARDRAQRFQSARDYQLALAAWGRNQGRASLTFAVTLSSEPPPVLHSSGGLPVAKQGSSSPPTAVLPSSSRRNVASGTPGTTPAGLGASPLPDSRNASPMALGRTTPSTPSGSREIVDVVDPRGTPTAWSGHTPLMPGGADRAVGSDPPRVTSNAPRTTPSPALTRVASKGPGKTLAAIGGVFALLAIAVVVVVVRTRTGEGPKTVGVDAPAPLESVGSVVKVAEPPPPSPSETGGAVADKTAPPGAPSAVASSTSAAPPGTPIAHAPAPLPVAPRNREPAKGDPSKAPPIASSVAAPAAPPPPPAPAPPPSGSGKRKFRTDID